MKRASPAPPAHRSRQLAEAFLWALVLVAPLLVWPTAKDAFRLPKLMAAEWLGLASVAVLAWRLRRLEKVGWRRVVGRPVFQAAIPLAAVAGLTLLTSPHPLHVRQGLADLGIGVACLVAWSAGLPAACLRRLLDGWLLPCLLLVTVAGLQFHDLWEPLTFVDQEGEGRLGITSLAGNPGDLAAYLVLPCLFTQHALWTRRRHRALWGAALAVLLYGVAVTQSLTAVVALGVASVVLWLGLVPRRRALAWLAGGAVLAAALVLAAAPLRVRLTDKLDDLRRGEINRLLTGRLDGWRAAAWMLGSEPLSGVGHGAYRATFIDAKMALVDRGEEFFGGQQHPVFANAHNEYLEAAAEWGWPGLAALAWALFVLWRESGRLATASDGGGERALARAGIVALAVMALTFFPFRVALVAYPALLFLAWVFRAADERREAAA